MFARQHTMFDSEDCAFDEWDEELGLAYRKDLPSYEGRVVYKTKEGFIVEGVNHIYDDYHEAKDVAFEFVQNV